MRGTSQSQLQYVRGIEMEGVLCKIPPRLCFVSVRVIIPGFKILHSGRLMRCALYFTNAGIRVFHSCQYKFVHLPWNSLEFRKLELALISKNKLKLKVDCSPPSSILRSLVFNVRMRSRDAELIFNLFRQKQDWFDKNYRQQNSQPSVNLKKT